MEFASMDEISDYDNAVVDVDIVDDDNNNANDDNVDTDDNLHEMVTNALFTGGRLDKRTQDGDITTLVIVLDIDSPFAEIAPHTNKHKNHDISIQFEVDFAFLDHWVRYK
jgi:hypothetical protein